jgi:pyruvate/2-oxoglutarate dehydrogenase complex dihydrolipoamide acyltransferase (E2) component
MITEFVMPKLAMAMNEGTVNEWLAQEGDYVEKGMPVAVVETEKVSYDIESPHAGYLHILVPEGATVDVEAPIAEFASDEESYHGIGGSPVSDSCGIRPEDSPAAVVPPPAARTEGNRIKASPLARKMAADRGLELESIAGTGPGGRIVKRDILSAEPQERPVGPADVTPAVAEVLDPVRIPFKGVRATIAKRMMESLDTTAQLSTFWEVELDTLLALRQSFVERQEQLQTRVSVNAFLVKAIAHAATQVPIANAEIEGDEILIHRAVNIGIATALPGATEYDSSLVVPVLKNVQSMGLVQIDKAMKSLIERARSNELGPDELSGSTITLSSTAGIAPQGMRATPLLNLPNTTVVGPSTPLRKPVARGDEIVLRTMLPISMTFDHRVMDGEPASRFGKVLSDVIEQPGLMLA